MVDMYESEEQGKDERSVMRERAASYRVDVLPELLDRAIFWGMLLGALLGVFVGWLLQSGYVAPAGWAGLFSLGLLSFYSFFALSGAAVGLMVGGVAALMAAERPERERRNREA